MVVTGVIVTRPVDTEPMPIVPVPLALIVKLLFAPLSVQAIAVVPAVAAAVIRIPVTQFAVALLSCSVGLVAPCRPQAKAAALADVCVTVAPLSVTAPAMVVAGVIVTAPVETDPTPIVPEPLALIVKFVFAPLSVQATATVPPVAAPVRLRPATADAVEASMLKTGFVVPLGPTAKALADAEVIVWLADESVVNAPVPGVVAPTVPLMLMDAVPVRFVTVPEEGVPNAPLNATNAPLEPTLTPRAVTTPVPVVIVDGATPAPPPTTSALAASAADVFQVVPLLKYGIPPDVPATVKARVPAPVMGEPATEINPPVKDWPTDVTVPLSGAEIVIVPGPLVIVTPVPAVRVDLANVLPVVLPIRS